MNFPGEDYNSFIKTQISRRTKNGTRIHVNLPGEAKRTRTHQNFQESFFKIPQDTYDFAGEKNVIRTDQIFQEILSKISLEHIRFSRRKKNQKNRSKFPGELS